MVIGVSLLGGGSVGVAVVAAVFLSNVPESLSAATGLRKAGHSSRWILGLWTGVALLSAAAATAGYGLFGGASSITIAVVQAFAAGAILTMLADTMMPEGFEHAGSTVGLVTSWGLHRRVPAQSGRRLIGQRPRSARPYSQTCCRHC